MARRWAVDRAAQMSLSTRITTSYSGQRGRGNELEMESATPTQVALQPGVVPNQRIASPDGLIGIFEIANSAPKSAAVLSSVHSSPGCRRRSEASAWTMLLVAHRVRPSRTSARRQVVVTIQANTGARPLLELSSKATRAVPVDKA